MAVHDGSQGEQRGVPALMAPRRGRATRRVDARETPRRGRFSTLTLRILAPNMIALAVLVGGVLWLDQYRDRLLDAKIAALQTQAEIIAGAVGESALVGDEADRRLDPLIAQQIVRRLVVPTRTRARLFDAAGALIADSRDLVGAGRDVQLRYLPPLGDSDVMAWLERAYDWVAPRLPSVDRFPPYRERGGQRAEDYAETRSALRGEVAGAIRRAGDENLVIIVAVPVQNLRRVVGALMLSTGGADIAESVRAVRLEILQVFGLALAITVLLSIFFAGTIERPVRRLAQAADRVRQWRGRRVQIPDFSRRRDEIGDLSVTLGAMTTELYARLDAIESFAADVAHEIRNPLTSLRSAIETLERSGDEADRLRMAKVIKHDVARLDRLISDIADASRLDAELTRAEVETVDLADLVRTVAEIHESTQAGAPDAPRFHTDLPDEGVCVVEGLPSRLAQVVDNLVANAVSFSPPGGLVELAVRKASGGAEIIVADQGPGLPEDRIERIFDRFHSRRPAADFGGHSGLGLSIAKQIVDAHGGRIRADNWTDPDGRVGGARFRVFLPG